MLKNKNKALVRAAAALVKKVLILLPPFLSPQSFPLLSHMFFVASLLIFKIKTKARFLFVFLHAYIFLLPLILPAPLIISHIPSVPHQ